MLNMQEYLSKFVNTTVNLVMVSNNHIQGDLLDVGADYLLVDQSASPLESRAVVVPIQAVESIQLVGTRQQLLMQPAPERTTQERPAVEAKDSQKQPQPAQTSIRRR